VNFDPKLLIAGLCLVAASLVLALILKQLRRYRLREASRPCAEVPTTQRQSADFGQAARLDKDPLAVPTNARVSPAMVEQSPEQPTGTPQQESALLHSAAEVYLAEYAALRDQVNTFMTFEVQIVYFALILLGVVVAAVVQGGVLAIIRVNPYLLLVAGCLFIALGALHTYEKFRLFVTISYIENVIRPALQKLYHGNVLCWEDFLLYCNRRVRLLNVLSFLRHMVFVGPAICLALFYVFLKSDAPRFDAFDISLIVFSILMWILYLTCYKKLGRDYALKLGCEKSF
jgi:hypothetical protein